LSQDKIHETLLQPADIIKEPEILNFFMNDIESLLDSYDYGRPEHKPDVTKQLEEIKKQREDMIKEHAQKQMEYNNTMNKINMMYMNPQNLQNTINQQTILIQQLSHENNYLKDKVNYLENKINLLISEKVKEAKREKELTLQQSCNEPNIII
jgi:predicted nuclease with TOPRIM domain